MATGSWGQIGVVGYGAVVKGQWDRLANIRNYDGTFFFFLGTA